MNQNQSFLSGSNVDYMDQLYADYMHDPQSVSADWRSFFDALSDSTLPLSTAVSHASSAISSQNQQQSSVANLINAYRSLGHHAAHLDPLDMVSRVRAPSLELGFHHLSEADLNRPFYAGGNLTPQNMPLKNIIQAFQNIYCGSIGVEYMHISNAEETSWLQAKMEQALGKPTLSNEQKISILNDLIAADGLERYLGTRYVGQKRFSLEGGDSLIPMLKELIRLSGESTVREIIIGMAHRGRLNVLVNVLGKEPNALFEEFEGKIKGTISGDVKYHMGFASNVQTQSGQVVHLALGFNPSHLEIIGPVVEGSVRSRLRRRANLEEKNQVIPVIIHGDAAFAGQGVVMETFNFSQARGYSTGGTIHIVINNQIGFTTSNPLDSRSTLYCTDVAKMVQAPILHVNGDDPEAVIFAMQIAFEFKMKFKRDVVIDLVCYRRHGHNEADEPLMTQPVMYQKIKAMKPLREVYAESLVQQGIMQNADIAQKVEEYRQRLDKGQAVVDLVQTDFEGKIKTDWTPYLNQHWNTDADTGVSKQNLLDLSQALNHLPDGFQLHPVVAKMMAERMKMAEGQTPINWGYAETMAYASLLQEGYGVRLSGQDCGRGTFSHRHAVLHNMHDGQVYIPLEHIAKNSEQPFVVIDSVLSEEAVLAFEYGYSTTEPESLVLWEAQFGDFANGAQVVVDQFISSGEQKWGRLCGLVMLLPHGYEGQGPEHSSARLERYMQLCAQENMQVCTPTTPAQIFHLLRRQMKRPYRKPLIIMTPKSLLRHRLAVSSIDELASGTFQNVIPEIDVIDDNKVTKLVFCCGKVYYDLLQARRERKLEHIAIVRIEQLYPFPEQEVHRILQHYTQAKQIVWCQEEPQNQGAWLACQPWIQACLSADQTLYYVGRAEAAAPAVGSPLLHAKQQQDLVDRAL